jgi:hypothetical protein
MAEHLEQLNEMEARRMSTILPTGEVVEPGSLVQVIPEGAPFVKTAPASGRHDWLLLKGGIRVNAEAGAARRKAPAAECRQGRAVETGP